MKTTIGLLLLAASSLLHAQTLNFDTAPASGHCEIPWFEEGLAIVAQGPESDPSHCFVENFQGGIGLLPGQIRVDISGLDITSIEADINDFTGVGATRLFVLNANGGVVSQVTNQSISTPETLVLNGSSGQFLVVEGSESALSEIRITTNPQQPEEFEITLDTDPSNQPAGIFVVCWPSAPGVELERSLDLIIWEKVPQSEIENGNVGLCHNVNSVSNSRYFYRLAIEQEPQ